MIILEEKWITTDMQGEGLPRSGLLEQPLADNWVIFDNSENNNPIKVAEGNLLTHITIYQEQQWELFNGYNNE